MRLFSIIIFHRKECNTIRLAEAIDVSEFGMFQKGAARELLTFFSRNVVNRSSFGDRTSVAHQQYVAHVRFQCEKLACVVVTDQEYPSRVAFDIVENALSEFINHPCSKEWNNITVDTSLSIPRLETLLKQYQIPEQVDKILKIQKDVDETKAIMFKNIEDMLERNEKIDDILQKSNDLSVQSKTFLKKSKQLNGGCCR